MAINEDYVIGRLFDARGHTGNVYYVRFVELFTGKIYNAVTKVMAANTSWEDSATVLIEDGVNGSFPIVVPNELPAGYRYNYLVYTRAGSIAANTDDITKQAQFDKGSDWGF